MALVGDEELGKRYTDAQSFNLGDTVTDFFGREFRFHKYNSGAGAVNAVAGQLGYLVGTGTTGMVPWECTMDYSSNAAATAITCPSASCGFFQAALQDGEYGFLQTKGPNRIAMLTDGGVSAGDRLTNNATDGRVITLVDAAPPLETLAIALADDAATALGIGDAVIQIPI